LAVGDFLLNELLTGVKRWFIKNKSDNETVTLQNAVSATGNGVDFSVVGFGSATLQITGIFVATVVFYGSVDGINFVNIPTKNRNLKTWVFSTTTTGLYDIDCSGLAKIRAVVTWTSGTSITIIGNVEAFSGSNNVTEISGDVSTFIKQNIVNNTPTTILAGTTYDSPIYANKRGTVGAVVHISETTPQKGILKIGQYPEIGNCQITEDLEILRDFSITGMKAAGGILAVKGSRSKVSITNNDAVDWTFDQLDIFWY